MCKDRNFYDQIFLPDKKEITDTDGDEPGSENVDVEGANER